MKICKSYPSALLSLVAVLALSGCASVLSESDYPISISSDPSGAQFTIVDAQGVTIHSGSTPSRVSLPASTGFFQGQKYTITVSKDGKSSQATLVARVDGWYFANMILLTPGVTLPHVALGLAGLLIVDPATGALWRLDTMSNFDFNLGDDVADADADESTLHIMDIEELPDEARTALIPVH